MQYDIVIEKAETNFCAYVPNLPVCVTVGHSRAEILTNMHEAMTGHLEAMAEDSDPLPPCLSSLHVVAVEVPESHTWSAHTRRYVVLVEPLDRWGHTAYVHDLDWHVAGCETVEETLRRVHEIIGEHVKWAVQAEEELVMPTTTIDTVEVSVPRSLAPARPAGISATS